MAQPGRDEKGRWLTGRDCPAWQHGLYSQAAGHLTQYLRGGLAETAEALERSDDLGEELLALRVMVVRLLQEQGAAILNGGKPMEALLALLLRLERFARTNQRLRQSRAVSPEERLVFLRRMRDLVYNWVGREDVTAFQARCEARLAELNRSRQPRILLEPVAGETAGDHARRTLLSYLDETARDIAANLARTNDMRDEIHLVRTLVAGWQERYDSGQMLEFHEVYGSWKLEGWLDLLNRLEKLTEADRAVRESETLIRDELTAWGGVVVAELLASVVEREDLPRFRDDVRRILRVELRDLTALVDSRMQQDRWLSAEGVADAFSA